MDKSYYEIAGIFAGTGRRWPQCSGAIAEVVRDLAVHFMDKDPNFNASLFLSACDLAKPGNVFKNLTENGK